MTGQHWREHADTYRRRAGQAGRDPSAGCISRIWRSRSSILEGRVVPRGVTGELCTRGSTVMLGYWERPRMHGGSDRHVPAGCIPAILRPWTKMATAPIVGRIKDMIIRGGENVYPREFEGVSLYTHPADLWTFRYLACPTNVSAKNSVPGSSCAPASRVDRRRREGISARDQIAHYKVPRPCPVRGRLPDDRDRGRCRNS